MAWSLARSALAVVPFTVLAGQALAIVGPSTDAPELADHLVMVLQHQDRTAGFCTGIVVTRDIVLTAAHCVPAGAEVRVHFPDPGHPPVLLQVRTIARHPDYRADAIRTRQRSIDLALVRLAAPLPTRFSPARFGAADGAGVGTSFTVAGFGVAQENEAASSGKLRRVALAARAPRSAVLLWAADPAGGGAGACTGDSGGPVMAQDGSVVALTLWAAGRQRRRCGDLTQALWLSPQRAWIDGIVSAWDAEPQPH